MTATPLVRPSGSAASWPTAGLPGTSMAPARTQSSLDVTASTSMRPMRPPAPLTAMRRRDAPADDAEGVSALIRGWRRVREADTCAPPARRATARPPPRRRRDGLGRALICSSVSASTGTLRRTFEGVDGVDELALARQFGRFQGGELVAVEARHHAAPLRLGTLAPDGEDVVPAVGVEDVGEQRRAEHVAHLRARHAGLDGGGLLARHHVALHHLDAVGGDDAEQVVRRLQRGTARQRRQCAGRRGARGRRAKRSKAERGGTGHRRRRHAGDGTGDAGR